jgi:phospholipid transport system substrate-binding protein
MRKLAILGGLLLLSSVVFAKPQTPHEKVTVVTNQVIALIEEAKTYYDKDPQRFYKGIENTLDPVMDFPSFTRGVMGSYGTKGYFQSLKTPAERDAYKKNYARFVKTFKQGLINTYGKGLLAFNGNKIEVLPPTEQDKQRIARGDYVDVVQVIYGTDNKYQVTYKMRPDKKGEWLFRNVTIETINVGLLYRNQFIDSMAKYKNDFGQVVDNWVVDAKTVDEVKQSKADAAP